MFVTMGIGFSLVDLMDVEAVVIEIDFELMSSLCLTSSFLSRLSLRKLRSGGLGESNHMKAILVRESRDMEDGLVILDGKWMKDTNDLTNAK
ncbi:hypothetical protein Tco_0800147 [Tanacetum coccineum]|uniref:Uncharacterized protein n=1 Tax=Tanacetum coccineum TaxID=301880 RepID=A0ABQ4ZSB1_9ASTR